MSRNYYEEVKKKRTEENESSSSGAKNYYELVGKTGANSTEEQKKKSVVYDKKYQGYSYDQMKSAMQKVGQDTDEYKYLSEYGVNVGYKDLRDYDANLADLPKETVSDKITDFASRLTEVFGSQELAKSIKTESTYRDRLEAARNQYALDHSFDLYKEYLEKDDFTEHSQYDESKAQSAMEKVTGQDANNAYKFINNVDGVKDAPDQGGNMRGVGYDKLTEDERAVFNYIWNTEGEIAARDFLEEMEVMLSKRSYEENRASLEQLTSTPGGATAMSVLSVPASVAGGALSAVDTAVSALTGKQYNPYSAMKGLTNFATDTREMVGQQIADSTDLSVGDVNVGQFLYQTGMSMADSMTGAWLFGGGFSAIMGTSAATQTAKDLVEAGEDPATVALTAGAAGIAEALFEHVSLDRLLKAKDVENWKDLIYEAMKQAGVEATEEVFTEVSNIITDTVFRGGSSNVAQELQNYLAAGYSEEEARRMVSKGIWGDIAMSAVGGALSGGIMGGVFEGARLHDMKRIGKQINENATDEDLRKIVGTELKDGLSTKDHVSAKDYMAGKGGTLTDAQAGLLYTKAMTDAKTMFDETAGSEYVDLGEYRRNMDLYNRIGSKLFEGKSAEEKERIKARRTMNVGESTSIGNKEVSLQSVDHDENGNMILITSEGERVAPDDITLSKNDARIVSYAEKMDADMAEVFVSGYDGTSDVEAYVDSFNLAYEYGRLGYGNENVLRNKGVLTDAQAVAAYTAGIKGRAAAQQAKVDAVIAKHKGAAIKGKLDDSVIDYSNSGKGKVNYNDLTARQKQSVQFIKAFSKSTGVNITFTVSDVVNGERKGANGSYDPSTNTITLDVYAGIDNTTVLEDALIPTLSHELTHWMKDKAPELYAEMREIVMNTMGREYAGQAGVSDVVAAEMTRMEKAHPGTKVTEEMAVDELIARACEDMLSKSNVDFLAKLSQKQRKTLADRVKQAIADLKAWVKDLLGAYSSKSTEARILRKYEAELDKLSKTWDKALETALEANRALTAEGVTGELTSNVQNSDRDSEGRVLTEAQMEYFADSKVRNADGNLLVMYHGTPNGNHTTFRTGTYFTENPDYAKAYEDPGASMLSSGKVVDNPKTYKVYLNITKPFDTRKLKERRIFMSEYYRKYGTGAPLAESGLPDWTDGMDLQEFIEEMEYDYDGLILDEGATGGYGEEVKSRGLSYVVFRSNQVKNVDNEEPTMNPDIRYSDRDSDGRLLSNEQKDFFKDSKIRDEDGNLRVVYHGSDAEFTVFDRTKSRTNMDIQGSFFSPWDLDAAGYGGNVRAFYLNIKRPASESMAYRALRKFQGQNGAGIKAREYLESLGYDGVNNENEEYIAFYPEQIKSIDNTSPTDDADIRYSDRHADRDRDNFVKAINQWNRDGRPDGESFILGSTGDVLQGLGAIESDIYMNGDKIKKIFKDHPEITLDEIKKIPEILERPILVLASRNVRRGQKNNSRLVMFGSVKAKDGRPMLSVLDLRPVENRLILDDMQKVSSVYTKDNDPTGFVNASDVLYLDKKRTTSLLRTIGFQMPIELNESGYIGSIAYRNQNVKIEGKRFGDVVNVVEYTADDEQDRIRALNSQHQVMFSDRSQNWTLKPYADEQIENWKNSKRIVVYENENQMTQFVENAIADKTFTKKMYFGMVSDELAGEMKRLFGVEVYGYNCSVSGYEIRKVLKDHGDEIKESSRGQRAVKKGDFLQIPYVLSRPDMISDGGSYEGKPCYIFKRDGISVVGVISDKHLDLFVQTMYINKKNRSLATPPSDASIFSQTSKTPSGTASSNSISQTGEKSTEKQFSDRETESIYDKLGEKDRVLAENEKLKADVQRLRERLSLERKETGGKVLKDKDLAEVSRKVLNYFGSGYSKQEFAAELKEIYGYILESEDIEWYTIMSMASDLSRKALKDASIKVTNSYVKSIMKEIRNKPVSLSVTQMQELKNVYGDDYKKVLRGRVKIKEDGIALDSQWQEWAWQYPDMFNAEVTEGDQITALLDVYDALSETAETVESFNTEEAVRQMALEIYNQFWNVGTVTTLADKYEGQIRRIKYEHRQMISELRSNYKNRAERDKLGQRIADARYYHNIIKHREAEIQRVKTAGKKRMADYKDRQDRNRKIKHIIGNVRKLNDWLVSNSKDKHIPEVMKGSVAYLLNAIDPSSKQFLRTGEATKKDVSLWKALDKVRQMAEGMNSPLISEKDVDKALDTFYDLPAGFVDEIQELCNKVNELVDQVGDEHYILNEMSLEQLESLDKIVTVLKKTITQANKCMAIHHNGEIAELSKSSIKYMDSMEQTTIAGKIADFLQFDNALPFYTFRRFGEAGKQVFEALQDGWDRFAFNVKKVLDFTESTYTAKEVREWSRELHSFTLEDGAIQMSTAQIMSLYCTSKREHAKGHLFGGGIRIADIENGKQKILQAKSVTLTPEELNTIIGTLSKRQIEVADKLQEFMNTICSDWGNAVSMMRFGIRQFTEENYFPIQSDPNDLSVDKAKDVENSLYRLLNMSFTKDLTKGANNAIVISDIFDVFAQHSSDMAKYNALALPVLDAFKWYNFKNKVPKDNDSTQFNTFSVKKSMETAYGKGAQKYFRTFMEDMNGAESGGRGEEFSKKMMSNYKVAAVAANLRVAILQPTAYVRASCVIDPKYLLRGLSVKPQSGKAKEHCGMALWKSMGFYDTSITKGVQELIKHDESVADKVKDYSMKLAEWGDSITWGYLWNACEAEVRDTRSDLKIGSDEFNRAVAERLREVIYRTQVVDSTMTRTHLMRSKSALTQMGTAFMSEPMISYNMAADCAFDWMYDAKVNGKEKSGQYKRKALRSFGAFVATATASSLAAALIDSVRDGWEDEDDEYADKLDVYFKNVLENMGSAINPLEWIPWAKDVISMFNGYEPTRMDEAFLTSIMYAARKTMSRIKGTGRASDYNLVYSWMKALSQTSGLPIGNLMRDVVGVWNWTFGSLWDFLHIDTE